jgi:hypothetical protein
MLAKNVIEIQLSKIESLLTEAITQQNPGLWLIQKDLRTPIFMLEAIFKVYEKVYTSKEFKKIKLKCKALEDALGAVDFYNVLAKEFSSNKQIKPSVIKYIKLQSSEKITYLNDILQEENWLNGKRILKIRKVYQQTSWVEEEKELKLIETFYLKSIAKVNQFILETTFVFDNVEEDVHELRRRLRWLSIYPQAFGGIFQYAENNLRPSTQIKKYLTTEIVNSSYNVMPTTIEVKKPILLNKHFFLSLSWMIRELGKIKDAGLEVLILKDALIHLKVANEINGETLAVQILGKKKITIAQLLSNAQKMVQVYFKEDNLSKLVVRK